MGAYQTLLADPIPTLNSINPRGAHGSGNCPATAAALVHYLDTNEIVTPAGNFGGGFIIAEEAEGRPAPNIGAIIHRLNGMGPEARMVVYGSEMDNTDTNEGRHHFFVLIKIGRRIFYADAYTRPAVFAEGADQIRARCSWIHSFLYWTGGFHVRSAS